MDDSTLTFYLFIFFFFVNLWLSDIFFVWSSLLLAAMATFPSRVVIHQNQTQEQNDKEQEKWQHFSLFCHITINWKWICNSLLNSFIPDGIKKEKKPGRHNTQQQLDIKYEDKNWTCRNGRTRRNWSEPAACCYILHTTTTTTTTKNKKEPVRVDAPVYIQRVNIATPQGKRLLYM